MKELDLRLGDIPEQISDIERHILAEVQQAIDNSTETILVAIDLVAEIDWYFLLIVFQLSYFSILVFYRLLWQHKNISLFDLQL